MWTPQLHEVAKVGRRVLTFEVAALLATAALAGPATAGQSAERSRAGSAVQALPANHRLTAKLTGRGEVPRGDRNGKGHVVIRIRTGTGKACARARWHRIGRPAAAHIHIGRAGVSGPVVIDLSGSVTGGAHCASAPKPLLRKILAHPKHYYYNIHNAAFPAGAVRGQLHR